MNGCEEEVRQNDSRSAIKLLLLLLLDYLFSILAELTHPSDTESIDRCKSLVEWL